MTAPAIKRSVSKAAQAATPAGKCVVPKHKCRGVPLHRSGLRALRMAAAAQALRLGISDDDLGAVMVVVNELAVNAMRHGRTCAAIRLWRDHGVVYCQLTDHQPEAPSPGDAAAAEARAEADQLYLWLATQLCDGLTVTPGPAGTTVTAAFPATGR